MSRKRPRPPVTVNSPSSGSSCSELDDGLLKDKDARRASEKKRRDEVNLCMDELITLLSMSGDRSCPKKMDKASVLKECCRFVSFYHNLSAIAGEGTERNYKPSFVTRGRAFSDLLDSLDAFSFVVSRSGQILFATEMMLSCLGFTHRLMVGHSINEFLHKEDCASLGEMFTEIINGGCIKKLHCLYPVKNFTCRFRLNTENSEVGVPCIMMKFASFIYIRTWDSENPASLDSSEEPALFDQPDTQDLCMILVATPLSITQRDAPLLSNDFSFVFQLRISKTGTILGLDKHSGAILGFTQDEVLGSSFFDFVHPYHVASFGESMKMFIEQGYGSTNPFRLSSKGGRWIWITANGYTTYNPWNQKGEHMMLECKVLGIDEMDAKQRMWVDSNYVPKISAAPCDAEPSVASTKSASTSSVTFTVSKSVSSVKSHDSAVSKEVVALSAEELRRELEIQLQENKKELIASKQKILEQQRELYEEKDRFQRLLNVTLKLPDQSPVLSEQNNLSNIFMANYPAPPLPVVTSASIPYSNMHRSSTSTTTLFNNQPITSVVDHSKHSSAGISAGMHNQAQERLLKLIGEFSENGNETAYSLESEIQSLVNCAPSSAIHHSLSYNYL